MRAGNLSLLYENGSIRYISAGKSEIIRMIYFAVRDNEWITIPPAIWDEVIEQLDDSFSIRYNCRFKSDKIDFEASCKIAGNSGNSLTLQVKGKAIRTFEKNRIGFCVLHPIEGTAGQPCTIINTSGSSDFNFFLCYISPHQLFTDIKSMQWDNGVIKCRLDFTGDAFETEDQRNWTDASYKTYSTPLGKPFPVTLSKGEDLFQKVTFQAGKVPDFHYEANDIININIPPGEMLELPAVGISRSTRPEPLTDNEISILKTLRFDHYRVDVHLHSDTWKEAAEAAINEAGKLGYALELALFFGDEPTRQCHEMTDFFSHARASVSLITILHKTRPATPVDLASKVVPLLRASFKDAKIACGTNAGFAELNRNRPATGEIDYLSYSIHPQEHASDNKTLVENLKGQEYTVKSCVRFAGTKGVWISPVTLRRRFNANLESYEIPYGGQGVPPQVDPRLMSIFGACWSAGSLKYLCESGAKGITFFETAGERGIIQGDHPARWPEASHAECGAIFPVFNVFKFFLENKSFRIMASESDNPLMVDALVMVKSGKLKIMLMNFTSSTKKARMDFCKDLLIISQLSDESHKYSGSIVSSTGIRETTKSDYPLLLPSFSLTFIEGMIKDS